jgi:hypothetical protein
MIVMHLTRFALARVAFASALLLAAPAHSALADEPAGVRADTATPGVSPSPRPTEAPALRRVRFAVQSTASYVNQQFTGPGIAPPDAGAFASGSPIAPGTPYDLWTSSPHVTGYGVNHSLLLTPSYALSPQTELSATLGYGSMTGSANVAAYWGDQPMPTLNPHLGRHPALVAFPTANGADTVAAAGSALLSVSFARRDGNVAANAGWFDLAQGEAFVVNQPLQTNTPIAFTEPLPEGIGDGAPTLASLVTARSRLPLYGVELFAKPRAATSVELVDAELPEPPGTHARLQSASLDVHHAGRISYGAHVARVSTGGAAIGTTVLFGAGARVTPSDQGPLPTSTLDAQQMTVGGVRAELPLTAHDDAQLRLGASCYSAQGTQQTQSACTRGAYASLRLAHTTGAFRVALEAVRMSATYAPAILPYGTPENVWSPAYSWPGTWLKGDYQLVDSSAMGPNREGARVTTRFTVRGVEMRLAYAAYRQLRPFDATTAYQAGFVEGFFLPQLDAPGTLGHEQHAAASAIAHLRFADVELNVTDITLTRRASTGHPLEAVALDDAVSTLTLSRRFGTRTIASLGAGRNTMFGAFDAATPNVGITENVVFAALQWQQSAHWSYGVQYRLYSVGGMPARTLGGASASPAYHGPQIMVEQRFRS